MTGMSTVMECDPVELADRAGAWLEGEPVLHNVMCTVLARAVEDPTVFNDAGWFAVEEGGRPVGAAMITPPFLLWVTPMPETALVALAELLLERRPALPGVAGESGTATRFTGLWGERTGADAEPGMGLLVYRLDAVIPPATVPGRLRTAGPVDRLLLREWFAAFVSETGTTGGDTAAVVDRAIARGGVHVWDDGRPLAMATTTPAVAGVVRIGGVYSPPELRRRGYGSACVAAVSQQALNRGASACMLYTDETNPTSNAIYQRIGYRQVGTGAEYRFRYR
jgi:predicted GNAT family acetyltransferase